MAKQLKRKSRKIRGGKLLGQGTYGCAFKPSLVCSGEPEPREGSISKMLISKADADKEYSISKAIIRIDPTKKFFITASGACLHDGRSLNNTVNSSGKPCKFNPSHAQKYLIFYPMGGEGHFSIIIQLDKYASAIKSFRNLLEGLSVFHRSNMVHLDIKPDNILSTIIDGEYKTRFIDFGLSVTDTTQLNPTSQIVNILSDHLYINKHIFYPIDLLLMNTNSLIKSDPNRKNFLIDWYYNISRLEFYPTSTFLNPDGTKKITFDNLVMKYYNNTVFYNNTSSALKTVDIAGLGISFAYMYSRLTGHYSRIDDYTGVNAVAIKKPGQIPMLINKLKLGDFVGQQDVFDWHVNLANKVSIPFYDLIIKMMDYDGLNRPTATEALGLFDRFLRDIDECFSDTQLTEKALYFVGVRTHTVGRLNLPPPDALRKRAEAEAATRAFTKAVAVSDARAQAQEAARVRAEANALTRARAQEEAATRARAQAEAAEKAALELVALRNKELLAAEKDAKEARARADAAATNLARTNLPARRFSQGTVVATQPPPKSIIPEPAMPVPLFTRLSNPLSNPVNTRAANMAAAAARAANTQRKLRAITQQRNNRARARIEAYGDPYFNDLGMPPIPTKKPYTGYAINHGAGLQPYRNPLVNLGQNPYTTIRSGGGLYTRKQKKGRRL